MSDSKVTIKELKDLVERFRKERNWGKHHTSKNLAISIAIESAELMEKFQWDDFPEADEAQGVKDELADIIIYCLYMAVVNKIDISKAIDAKLEKQAKKYPPNVELNSEKYWAIKKSHRGA